MLNLDDGFTRGRPGLKAEVKHLQRMLNKLGYSVGADGYFGVSTQNSVKSFQTKMSLASTGSVDSKTWEALEREIFSNDPVKVPDQLPPTIIQTTAVKNEEVKLTQFHGDLSWIHAREGHAGKAYWPGGASGVTLDPGFDLGQQELETFQSQYSALLSTQELSACQQCLGIQGRSAKKFLNQSRALLGIRISRATALTLFPVVVAPYWVAITKRFPALKNEVTPAQVQTALLSIAFNRGANNKDLNVLTESISDHDWSSVGEIIKAMQQDHALLGIRKRRKMEGELILTALR